MVHGKNLVDVKNCNKKDTKLTHVWEFNGINSITKTYWKLLLHSKNVVGVVCKTKKDIKLTHAWELNGISSITKIY
jgi:hypothetical protein